MQSSPKDVTKRNVFNAFTGTIDDLPILGKAPFDWPLKVVQRAEIVLTYGTYLGFVAGKTEEGSVVYDTRAIEKEGKLYIEYGNHGIADPKNIKKYSPLTSIKVIERPRPLLLDDECWNLDGE
ncbi:MAG TPA: hypothetical protein VJJ23_03175 [Candidatus Nanoarchaeia archaeon]|nr:hypothetical protein [Candidatus Nanoarchaeia archaeon]